MTIFLFDKAVVDTVPWGKIREDYLVAKRYEYTLKQLDSLIGQLLIHKYERRKKKSKLKKLLSHSVSNNY